MVDFTMNTDQHAQSVVDDAGYPTRDHGRLGRQTTGFLLIVILVAGAAVRFFGLDIQSLWSDELDSYLMSAPPSWAEVWRNAGNDVHPPGYHLLLHGWLAAGGNDETALRLPSALCGVLALFALFYLGKRLFSPTTGLIAATLLSCNWFAVYYSQEARVYSLFMLVAVLSMLAWWSLFQQIVFGKSTHFGSWIAAWAGGMGLCYLHYYGLLPVGLQVASLFVAALIRRRHAGKVCLLALALLGGYGPWLTNLLRDMGGSAWMPRPDWTYLAAYFTAISGNSVLCLALFILVIGFSWTPVIRRRSPETRAAAAVTVWLWFLLPVGLTFAVSRFGTPIFTHRNLIICLPAFALIVGRAIDRITWQRKWVGPATLLICAAMFMHLTVVLDYYGKPGKIQYREVAGHLAAAEGNSPTIVLVCTPDADYFNYYFKRLNSPLAAAGTVCAPADLSEKDKDAIIASGRLWIARAHRAMDPEVIHWALRHFRLVEHRRFLGAEAFLFSRNQ